MTDTAPDDDLSDGFARAVSQLTAVDAELIALTASRQGRRHTHRFASTSGPVDVRSLAKVVTVLTLGAAARQGAPLLGPNPVDLDLPIGPLLGAVPHRPTFRTADRWERVRLRHLLANTTGYDQGFLFRADAADLITHRPGELVPFVADRELAHEPGTHFAYSNAGYYLLSVLISELSGRSLADWAGDLLLGPLGIPADEWSWRRYGRYPAGATGLRVGSEPLHRLAELLLHGGRADGRRLVGADWITAMTSPQIVPAAEPRTAGDPLPRIAYGLGVWLSEPAGRCFGVGADGQYLVVDAPSGTAITLTAARAQADVQAALRSAFTPLLAPRPTAPGPSTLG